MLISPTEPKKLQAIGTTSLRPEKYGCDILIRTKFWRIGIQRKKFPDDFVASLHDGRLYEQVHRMRGVDISIIVLEGFGVWTDSNQLVHASDFSMEALFKAMMSLAMRGVMVTRVRDLDDTILFCRQAEEWAGEREHRSFDARPGPKDGRNGWGKKSDRAYQRHLLQGIEGVGPDRADLILDHFETMPLQWSVGAEELMAIKGIGKVTVEKMMKALE